MYTSKVSTIRSSTLIHSTQIMFRLQKHSHSHSFIHSHLHSSTNNKIMRRTKNKSVAFFPYWKFSSTHTHSHRTNRQSTNYHLNIVTRLLGDNRMSFNGDERTTQIISNITSDQTSVRSDFFSQFLAVIVVTLFIAFNWQFFSSNTFTHP